MAATCIKFAVDIPRSGAYLGSDSANCSAAYMRFIHLICLSRQKRNRPVEDFSRLAANDPQPRYCNRLRRLWPTGHQKAWPGLIISPGWPPASDW